MSQQLVVSINASGDSFRWCWLNHGKAESFASGSLDHFCATLGKVNQQVWLLLPGSKVVMRELEYSEKEKKHLRNLLPYQLEDSVVGDIDDLHIALGEANKGKAVIAYTDKTWLRQVFEQFTALGLEITRCWSAPLLLPFTSVSATEEPVIADLGAQSAELESTAPSWVLALEGGQVNIRTGKHQGYSVPLTMLTISLELLLASKEDAAELPFVQLRAESVTELDALKLKLPAALVSRISGSGINDFWQLEFSNGTVDLCQAEFSQRLPLARWWKIWSAIGLLAAVTLVVYVGVLMFEIHKLNKENLQLRLQTETVYRGVVHGGQADDPEKRLRIKLAELEPKAQTGSVVTLLAGVVPLVASANDIAVKVISYTAETGDLSINAQSHSFNSLDTLRQAIIAKGYNVDPIVVNAQGDISTGRLKITKPAH